MIYYDSIDRQTLNCIITATSAAADIHHMMYTWYIKQAHHLLHCIMSLQIMLAYNYCHAICDAYYPHTLHIVFTWALD